MSLFRNAGVAGGDQQLGAYAPAAANAFSPGGGGCGDDSNR